MRWTSQSHMPLKRGLSESEDHDVIEPVAEIGDTKGSVRRRERPGVIFRYNYR